MCNYPVNITRKNNDNNNDNNKNDKYKLSMGITGKLTYSLVVPNIQEKTIWKPIALNTNKKNFTCHFSQVVDFRNITPIL